MAASVGTVTVNVAVGDDLEAAIRQIVRDEVERIARKAYRRAEDGSGASALYELIYATDPVCK